MNKDVRQKLQRNSITLNATKRRHKKRQPLKEIVSEPESITIPAVPKPLPIEVEQAQEIIFQPNPGPQTDFLSASEQEVLYGGAAGGGKSFAMLADPVR